MNQVSTISAPVAAEMLGAGSFFGSCQIAAGNFEAYLQSASGFETSADSETLEMPIIDEAPESPEALEASEILEMPAPIAAKAEMEIDAEAETEIKIEAGKEAEAETDFGIRDAKFPKLANILNRFDIFKEPKLLAQLQKMLGEEAGAEAFKIVKNFLKEYKDEFEVTLQELGNEPEFSGARQLLLRLIISLGYVSDTPTEGQQDRLKGILEEIGGILAKEQLAQPETEVETETLQPETETAEPEAKIAQPKTEIPQPEAKAEIAQPEIEIPQPEAKITRPEIEIETTEPKAEIAQPEIKKEQPELKAEQPKAEVAELPEAKAEQPKTEVAQPELEAEIAPQPKTKAKAEKAEQPEMKEAKISPSELKNMIVFPLAEKLNIKWEEREEFSDFIIEDLLEQGLISLEDVGDYFGKIEILAIAEGEEELDYFEETLKNLWESVKSEDEPQKEEWFSILKEITAGKELSRQLKESLGVEQKAEILSSIPKKEDGFKEEELNFANLANLAKPAKPGEAKQERHEKPIQPEVRAVWEGSTLKIEVFNPKTGEKLQTVETAMPHKMQERIHEFEVIKQITAQARFTTTPTGEQKLTMQLRPEHLGQVDLRITLNHGEMQIHARVESSTAQNALESHIGLLRDGLEKQGINLERLEVSVEQKDKQDAYSLAERQEQHEQRQRHRKNRRGKEMSVAISIKNDANSDTGRRLGYNTMEYLA